MATNASGLGLANYSISYVNGQLTVMPVLLTVTANNTNRNYGATNPAFTVTYSGFKNNDTTNVLSGSPGLTTTAAAGSPVGTYAIINSVGSLSAANYGFYPVNGTLTVTPAALMVAASNTNRMYGATNPVFTMSYTGFVNGDTTNVLSGSPGTLSTSATANSPVGTYVITNPPGTLSATNYAISYTNGTLTVMPVTLTVTPNNTNRIYGASNPVFTMSYTGFVNGDTTNVLSGSPGALSTSATANSPVGAYVITNPPGTLSATNYAISYTNGTLTVTPGTLMITANSTNRLYGAANPVLTASYSGFVNGDTVSVLSGNPGLTTAAKSNSPVGIYTITNTLGTLSATNYAFSFTNGILTVNPAALTVSANSTNRPYGATNPMFAVSYAGFVNGDTAGVLSGSLSLTTSATTNSPVGTYAITNLPGMLSATNYAISYTNGTLTVTPAALTITASNRSKIFGQTVVFAGTEFSTSGLLNSDSVSHVSLSSAGAVAGAPVNGSPYSIVVINAVGTGLTNYSISYVNGQLTVIPEPMPVILSFGLTNGIVTVTWSSVAGLTYGLQSTTNLTSGNWVSVPSNVTAAGLTASQTNAIGNAPQQFYRVKFIDNP